MPSAQEKAEYNQDPELYAYEDTFEDPEGEEIDHPYLGKTPTFSDAQLQRVKGLHGKGNPPEHLKYHVPLDKRGPYKLLNFPGRMGEREGPASYALCNGTTKTANSLREAGRPCKAKAINRSGFCSRHGGALCPLDRKRIDWEKAPRHIQFKYGKLSVDDLDDEELARGQIRKPDGSFTMNKFVSSDIHNKMIAKLFERSDELLRNNLLVAVETFAEIASGTAYEPADRLKAAEFIFTRLRGKVPQEIKIGVDKPFEKVLDAVLTGGSRAESRANREHDDDYIEGEVVEDLDVPDDKFAEMKRELEAAQDQFDEDEAEDEPELDEEDDYDYTDPRDKTLVADLEPKPVVSHGAIGKPTTTKPMEPEQAARYDEQMQENINEAEARRNKVFKKRKSPEEVAAERKAHKEEMKKGIARRKAAQNRGYSDLPKGVDKEVEEGDEEDEVVFRFKGTDAEVEKEK